MLVDEKRYTVQEFEQVAALPENADRMFELINGEIIEVSPGTTRNSEISYRIAILVHQFCQEQQIPFYVSGGDGAYHIGDHVIAPDFAYKRTPMSAEYPDPVPPAWAVEIISPSDKATSIREKRQIYRDAGILLWEVYPQTQQVDIYAPSQTERTVSAGGVLDGGEVLPGFSLPVQQLFTT